MTPTPTEPVASAAKAMYYFSFSAFSPPPYPSTLFLL